MSSELRSLLPLEESTGKESYKSTTKFGIEESVEQRIDGGIGGSEPLSNRSHHFQHVNLFITKVRSELDPSKENVEREPAEEEDGDDNEEHTKDAYFCLLMNLPHID